MNNRIKKLKPGPLDIHAHILPPALMERLEAGERAGLSVETAPDGKRVSLGGKRSGPPMLPGLYSMEMRTKYMADHGVAAQLLSPWIGLVPNHLGEADAFWLAEAVNRGVGSPGTELEFAL